MNDFFLDLEKVAVSLGGKQVLKDISFRIGYNEQWAVTGASGSGKTVLANTIAGKHFFSGMIKKPFEGGPGPHLILMVDQQHRFKDYANQGNFYYQQRFNSFDSETTRTVRQEIIFAGDHKESFELGDHAKELIILLQVEHLLNEPLIQLSNGENKRLQLIKALLKKPALLILDQPFTGLDTEGRKILHNILNRLCNSGQHILLITSLQEIPDCITHIASIGDGYLRSVVQKKEFTPTELPANKIQIDTQKLNSLFSKKEPGVETIVKMVDVNIKYGENQILENINWEVKSGDKWSLSGPNGAGKSTLLSLVTGDNPQAYANEIYLFGRRRGTGESIWDIKQNIGYVSPELHLYFDYGATAFQAVASGLFDTVGLFRKLSLLQHKAVSGWMEFLQLSDKQHKLLSQLSAGEQRLVLLGRALIKNPQLLVLDEPCQGLDEEQSFYFISLIDEICKSFQATLIYVSHYQRDLPSCIDHYLRLEKGRPSEI